MRQVVLGAVGLLRQGGVDLGLADVDPALGEILAQPLQGDLVTQGAAELVEGHAVAGQALAQPVHAQAVLLGDGGHGLVDFLVAGADALAARALDLQPGQDQALEHLPFQHRPGRQLGLVAGVLGLDVAHGQVQLALQDHVLVDDGGDAFDRFGGLGQSGGREQARGGGRQHDCGQGGGDAQAHGLTG